MDIVSNAFDLSPATNAELLVVGPKIVGAIIAAAGDVYTGLLARKIYGKEAGTYAVGYPLIYKQIILYLLTSFHLGSCY